MSLTQKIDSLFEPRFITPPETSELIEAIVTASDARSILEVGMHTGFASLHILRAIVGKQNARLVSVDYNPVHDRAYFSKFSEFSFLEGKTPEILSRLNGSSFDVVFVDSDHSVNHTKLEIDALFSITKKGTLFLFHDIPEWQSPRHHFSHPVREYLFSRVRDGTFRGLAVPTCEQIDCREMFGPGYPPQCNPHLGVFIRL
jgi:hypothetical protein